jgi:hypothetical protein
MVQCAPAAVRVVVQDGQVEMLVFVVSVLALLWVSVLALVLVL